MDFKEARKLQKKRLFIEKTAELLKEKPFEAITIRCIAEHSQYNSATLYTYFADLDELRLLAIFRFSHEYIKKLGESISEDASIVTQYVTFYDIFISFIYKYPAIYLYYFFGTHGYLLENIVQAYYALFPEEQLEAMPETTKEILSKGGLYGFHECIVAHLVEAGYVTAGKQDLVTRLLTHTQKSFLYDLSQFPEMTPELGKEQFMYLFMHMISL